MITAKEQQLINMAHWLNDPLHATMASIFVIWSMIWMGVAMWKAAQNNDKYWFVAFLFIHTGGILEIIYLFFLCKKKEQ